MAIRVPSESRRAALTAGARAVLPILFGVAPFGVIFGALAVASGIPVWMTAGMSAFVFAGSAQFVAVGLIAGGSGVLVIALTTFLVNVRHNLYAATLAPHLGKLPKRWLLPIAYLLTDETYVTVIRTLEAMGDSRVKQWYYMGAAATMYVVWQISTWVGIWAGASVSDPAGWGLDFALPATFIVMLMPLIRSRGVMACVLVAGVLSLLLNGLPFQTGLVISVAAGALAGALLEVTPQTVLSVEEPNAESPTEQAIAEPADGLD